MTDITTIIRIHSINCLDFLERALFSLVGQKVDVSVIIVAQRLFQPDTEIIQSKTASYIMGALKDITIMSLDHPYREDLRSYMLNRAIEVVKSRFVHILDYDDIMYPNAYYDLISPLKRTSAAISFGAIISVYFEKIGHVPYVLHKRREFFGKHKYDLFVDNFCPIHSFAIDLSKIDRNDVVFDEEMSALEDYSFLIGFLAKYDADFSNIDRPVGEYFRRESDTIQSADNEFPDPDLRVSKLQKAREIILEKKRSTKVSVRASEFAWLFGAQPKINAMHATNTQDNKTPIFYIDYAIDARTGSLLFNLLRNSAVENSNIEGYIDSVSIDDENTIVKGWVNDSHPDLKGYYLLLATSDGNFVSIARRHARDDVSEHVKSVNFDHGFEFAIPEVYRDSYGDKFGVFLVSADGINLSKVAIHESLVVAPFVEEQEKS